MMLKDIANRLARFIVDVGQAQPYGGEVFEAKVARPHFTINFSSLHCLDGSVCLYGPQKIIIQYQTNIIGFPPEDNRRFTSEEDALKFLQLAFVELKFKEAFEVPVDVRKKL